MEDWQHTQKEAIQLVKDVTTKGAQEEVEFYIVMMVEDGQSFEDITEHMHDAFQSDETKQID